MKILRLILLLFLCFYGGFLGVLFFKSKPQRVSKAKYAVVLGNKVNSDGTPSKRLQARLNKSIELYRRGIISRIICSGGIDKLGVNEAEKMADYLVQKRVKKRDIIIDSLGNNTHSTAQNCRKILSSEESLILVSERYHLPRCRLAFTHAGFTRVQSASPRFFEMRTLYSWLREVPAYGKYFLKKL